MKTLLLIVCTLLFLHSSDTAMVSTASAASVNAASRTVTIKIQTNAVSKKTAFTPLPAFISNASREGFTLHFSNICTRTDLHAYPVTVSGNRNTYPCQLLSVSDGGTSADYAFCETLPEGSYTLRGFPAIRFTLPPDVFGIATDSPTPPPTEEPSNPPVSANPLPAYSYTLIAQTKKHEKISHAFVEIYLDNTRLLSGKTNTDGIYRVESSLFRPDTTYTVRVCKPVSPPASLSEESADRLPEMTFFEEQEFTFSFSDTYSVEQCVALLEPPETSSLPLTICWSFDAWNALSPEHLSVKISLWDVEESACVLTRTYVPDISGMTVCLPVFEKESLHLSSGSYKLRISIQSETGDEIPYDDDKLLCRLKLLNGEWITPIIINLP